MVDRASVIASCVGRAPAEPHGADHDDHEDDEAGDQELHHRVLGVAHARLPRLDGSRGAQYAVVAASAVHGSATQLAGRARCGPGTRGGRCRRRFTDDAAHLERAARGLRWCGCRGPTASRRGRIRQRQVWPSRLLSISPSTSSRPSSGPTLSFQSVAPEQEPRRTTSSSLAPARPAAVAATTPSDGGAGRRRRRVACGWRSRCHGVLLGLGRIQRHARRGQPTIVRWSYDLGSRRTGSPTRTGPRGRAPRGRPRSATPPPSMRR